MQTTDEGQVAAPDPTRSFLRKTIEQELAKGNSDVNICVLFAVFLFSSVSEVLFGSRTFHHFFLTFSCIGLLIVNRANWL